MADGMKASDHDSYTMARMLEQLDTCRNYKYVLVLRAMHAKGPCMRKGHACETTTNDHMLPP